MLAAVVAEIQVECPETDVGTFDVMKIAAATEASGFENDDYGL
jgi:hypothetical protein